MAWPRINSLTPRETAGLVWALVIVAILPYAGTDLWCWLTRSERVLSGAFSGSTLDCEMPIVLKWALFPSVVANAAGIWLCGRHLATALAAGEAKKWKTIILIGVAAAVHLLISLFSARAILAGLDLLRR